MKNNITLCTLAPGERAVITGIAPGTGERRRLRELGMSDGEQVECVLKHGGISAYLVKGTLIALRGEDADVIFTGEPASSEAANKGGCVLWR